MTVLDVTYFKGGTPAKELSKADNARIIELGGDRRTAQIMIKDHKDRGILPKKDSVKNISKEDMNKIFGDSKSKEANVDSLTQTPYIRKMIASTNRIASELLKVKTASEYHIHDSMEGYWIKAKGMDVFVGRDMSIQKAIDAQCGCAMEGARKPAKRWITIDGDHIPILTDETMSQAKERIKKEKEDSGKGTEKPKETPKEKTKKEPRETMIDGKKVKSWIESDSIDSTSEEEEGLYPIPVFENETPGDAMMRFMKEKKEKDKKDKEEKQKPTDMDIVDWAMKHTNGKELPNGQGGGVPASKEQLAMVKEAFLALPQEYKDLIPAINVNKIRATRQTVAGQFDPDTKEININMYDGLDQNTLNATMFHEAAHVKWNKTDQKIKDEWKKFVDDNPNLHDVTGYTRSFFDGLSKKLFEAKRNVMVMTAKLKRYEEAGAGKQAIEDIKRIKESWEDGIPSIKEEPYDEMHSEVFSQFQYPSTNPYERIKFDKLKIAYPKLKEIFG